MPRPFLLLLSCLIVALSDSRLDAAEPEFRLATFSAEVTPPIGHSLLGGATTAPPASRVVDPLYAHGFVLLGGDSPMVVVSIDWCEIRNDAYDRWRSALAEAAGTRPSQVLVTAIHQHDAPLADLEAQRILERHGAKNSIIDLPYHERCVQATAKALRESLGKAQSITHIGMGQAVVHDLVSNRRFLDDDGTPRFDRSSMSGGLEAHRRAPPGLVDPYLKTLSFWNGDTPVCALSVFAIHPMSYWATGWVTSDFPGLARERRQRELPEVHQIYASGASGNVTAGKYNDGSHANREILTQKLHAGMVEAWGRTERRPISQITHRSVPVKLEARTEPHFSVEQLTGQLDHPDPKRQSLAALGLSWHKRLASGQPVEIPTIDFGSACLVLLPGESYLEYQLLAQSLRPDDFVVVMGYGESAPGYIATDRAWDEQDTNLVEWCWVGRSEAAVHWD